MRQSGIRVARRSLLTAAAATAAASVVRGQAPAMPAAPAQATLAEAPAADGVVITVERRDDIVLIGINRTSIYNRLDGAARRRMAQVFYAYEHDPSLRAAVLFGHGDCFSRGIDVDAAQAGFQSGQPAADSGRHGGHPGQGHAAARQTGGGRRARRHLEPRARIYLACDVRIAAANTEFGQDENSHGRFPGGGATVRFVREAGWGNAMRYMLTGDHWTAAESYRMGITQLVRHPPGRTRGRDHDGPEDRRLRTALDQSDIDLCTPRHNPHGGRRAGKDQRRLRGAL